MYPKLEESTMRRLLRAIGKVFGFVKKEILKRIPGTSLNKSITYQKRLSSKICRNFREAEEILLRKGELRQLSDREMDGIVLSTETDFEH